MKSEERLDGNPGKGCVPSNMGRERYEMRKQRVADIQIFVAEWSWSRGIALSGRALAEQPVHFGAVAHLLSSLLST